MNSIVLNLALSKIQRKSSLKVHYYRYRSWLHKKLGDLPIQSPWDLPGALELIETLAKSAPLLPRDVSKSSQQELIRRWNQFFPKDRLFYRMLFSQAQLLRSHKNKTLEQFLCSGEGVFWITQRHQMKRKALFEWDRPFKQSKQAAMDYESQIRELLRAYPLLTWSDLKEFKIKNAQKIFENFPQRGYLREIFLEKIKERFHI